MRYALILLLLFLVLSSCKDEEKSVHPRADLLRTIADSTFLDYLIEEDSTISVIPTHGKKSPELLKYSIQKDKLKIIFSKMSPFPISITEYFSSCNCLLLRSDNVLFDKAEKEDYLEFEILPELVPNDSKIFLKLYSATNPNVQNIELDLRQKSDKSAASIRAR